METKSLRHFAFLFLLLLLLLLSGPPAASAHNIPAVIALGDSTLDPGNNNLLRTLVRANHKPYGHDFPGGPTGRFSNGKLITDFLVSSLGIKDALPAYSSHNLTTADLATGVSFASAGSGLDDMTWTMSNVIGMEKQLSNFEAYIHRLRDAVGRDAADRTVADALIIVGVGSNDMMMNFYLTPARRTVFGSAYNYQRFLLRRLWSFVQKIHDMGGRNIAIAGLPPIGCLPFQMTLETMTNSRPHKRACINQQNKDAVKYNRMLNDMVGSLRSALPGTKLAYVDIYNPLMDMIKSPLKYGFLETRLGCCGTGLIEMGPDCLIPCFTCPDPSRFLFWDSVHPSQATYQALANEFMRSVLPQFTN